MGAVPRALEAIGQGRMIVLGDDRDGGGGVLCMAADRVTPDAINFMATHARGLVCLPLVTARLRQLEIPLMVEPDQNESVRDLAFGVSIEAREGVTTGISAHDRAQTVRTAVSDEAGPDDLARPGHVFPIQVAEGGVFAKAAPAEASVDLAQLAGRRPAAVICQIIDDEGHIAEGAALEHFALRHGLTYVSVSELLRYRYAAEEALRHSCAESLPTIFGDFRSVRFTSSIDGAELIALVRGVIRPEQTTHLHIHRECPSGDLFGSERCECGSRLQISLRSLGARRAAVLIYLREKGGGDAHALGSIASSVGGSVEVADSQAGSADAYPRMGLLGDALRQLGVRKLHLEPTPIVEESQLAACGFELAQQVPPDDLEASLRDVLDELSTLRHASSV